VNQLPPEAFDIMNDTELASRIRYQTGLVVKKSVPRERLVALAMYGTSPDPHEQAATNDTRKRLQLYIAKNWIGLQSQLPCKGEFRGQCTVYPCPEGRHVDCLIAAAPHMNRHDLQP